MNQAAALAISVLFMWTNPSLNADGTPLTDLASLTLEATREADGIVEQFPHPLCSFDDTGNLVCISGVGLPDSMNVVLPQHQGTDWWRFRIFAIDSTGNISEPSNVVRLDMGDGGPITGIPVEPAGPQGAVVEWFDARGRRLDHHGMMLDNRFASGVYFRRIGNAVRKVVWVK